MSRTRKAVWEDSSYSSYSWGGSRGQRRTGRRVRRALDKRRRRSRERQASWDMAQSLRGSQGGL